jgi:hypothetical protein
MRNRTELQNHVAYLLYRMIDDIIVLAEDKLGDKVNYNELKAVINGCEDIQDSVDDQISRLFTEYLEKYGLVQ